MEAAIKPLKLAIIGAGVSGLAAAYSLHALKNVKITIFEKSKGFSGRAATRRKENFCWDFGANYFSTEKPELADFVLKTLPTDDLIEIKKPIYTFDSNGKIEVGNPEYNKKPKWNYKSGINNIGKLLHKLCEDKVECKRSIRIEKLVYEKSSEAFDGYVWRLHSTEKEDLGTFDAILLTPPSPQIVDLLKTSDFSEELLSVKEKVLEGLGVAEYQAQISVALAYKKRFTEKLDYFALINLDRKHDVAWLSVEDDKQGHVPDGSTLLMIQMAAAWSKNFWEKSVDEIVLEVREKTETLLQLKDQINKDDLLFSDVQKWRFALPSKAANKTPLLEASKCGLFFGGDYLVGKGRVLDALETGLQASEQIKSKYRIQPSL